MVRYLFDTGFCREVIRHRPPAMRERFNRDGTRLAISVVTLMELYAGAEASAFPDRNREVIDALAARLLVLDYGAKAALHTAEIMAEQSALGLPIGAYEAMIAGHARSEGLILVTTRRPSVDAVPGLLIETWLDEGPF